MNEEMHSVYEWWKIRTDKMTMPLPCFECHREVEILWRNNTWFVQCPSCFLRIKMPRICSSLEDVIKMWNLFVKQKS